MARLVGQPPQVSREVPAELLAGFVRQPEPGDFYYGLTDRQQQQFITWTNLVKRESTRTQRVAESLDLMVQGKQRGMK